MNKDVSNYLKEIGSKGGNSRRDKLTPKRRSQIARKAAKARWKTKPV